LKKTAGASLKSVIVVKETASRKRNNDFLVNPAFSKHP